MAPTKPKVENMVLEGRDILIFIDDKAAVLTMNPLSDSWIILQDSCRQHQDIFKIENPPVLFGLLIGVHQCKNIVNAKVTRRRSPIGANGLGIGISIEHGNLRPLNLGG